MTQRTVSLIGATGSIGTQAADVVRQNPDRFDVVGLGAHRSAATLVALARELRPAAVAIGDDAAAAEVRAGVPGGTEVLAGPEALAELARRAEVVVNGVVGFAGLPVTLAALQAGRRLALANKESLIAGAPVVQKARTTVGAEILPVDSEHCAIHQCLEGLAAPSAPGSPDADPVARLWITASGGPFRGRRRDELDAVTVDEALAHPTWRMGPKITVDSSTLMNKGLEVIEAHELFGLPYDRISVVVHPQSVVHSMVELTDGSTIAQLSHPDMRLPIGYAMGWPDRLTTAFGAVDWSSPLELSFEPPARDVFACLELAYAAGRQGGGAPAWLNAANEVAVDAFLAGRLAWLAIADVVSETLERWDQAPLHEVADVLEADRCARLIAAAAVARRAGGAS